ncbi:MAG: pro-sigmaK processing inhibitor BofA family protein [Oscillospiraceae bacterium]|nr:pro-sigmaK processing inhibitor BofA family protein [Oscillospiraceae bacterium]
MEEISNIYPLWLVAAVVLIFILLMFRRPLGALVHLLVRTALGVGALALIVPVGKLLGIQLGVNLVNALVLGALGVPGFGLLMMLNWLVGA